MKAMNAKRILNKVIIAAVLLSFIILAIVFRKEYYGEEDVIRIGVSPFQDTLIPILGSEFGWYEEEGLKVEISILGWTEIQESLSSGSSMGIDVGINNISSVIGTHGNNTEIIYYYGVNTFDDGFALMIHPDGKFKTVQDFLKAGHDREDSLRFAAAQLRGSSIITTSRTDMEQGVVAFLNKAGLEFDVDYNIINLNPDEGLASFIAGDGDAYIGGIPQRTRAESLGKIPMVTGADLGPPPINGFVTTKSFYLSNSDSLLKLLKVWFRIVNYVNENIDEAAEIIVAELNENSAANFTTDDFKRFWNNIEHYPANPTEINSEILSPDGRNYWRARWDDTNKYFHEVIKTIDKPVSPSDAFYMIEVHEQLIIKYDF